MNKRLLIDDIMLIKSLIKFNLVQLSSIIHCLKM